MIVCLFSHTPFLFCFWTATTQDACRETTRGDYTANVEGKSGLIKNLIAASINEDCGMELSIEWCEA